MSGSSSALLRTTTSGVGSASGLKNRCERGMKQCTNDSTRKKAEMAGFQLSLVLENGLIAPME